MAIVPTEIAEVTRDLAVVVQSRHEQFAVLVASGLSYRQAARRAGYNPDNSWRLMQMPRIRERVEELTREPEERVRAGIDLELIMLRNRAADGDLTDADRADIELRLKLLLAHAKLRGMIVHRKQVASARLNLGKINRADLEAMLAETLESLAPGKRAQLMRIAAGELAAADGESASLPQ